MIVDDRVRGVSREGDSAHNQLIEQHPKRVNIGALIQVAVALGLLWRDILGGAHQHIRRKG